MADRGEVSVVTLGGKGSSLSSSSLSAVATGRAQVRIDSSALDRLSSSSPAASFKHTIVVPQFQPLEETRAFLVVLLNKLLLCNSPRIRTTLPELIAQSLNSKSQVFEFGELDVTEDELFVLKNPSSSSLLGIAGVLDHQSAALSAFADLAAALSCEALKADVTAFNLMDSGDGHTSKEEVGVASDLRVLLNGSKLVGKAKIGSVAKIPKVHGTMREQVKSVHSKMRVELNSGLKFVENKCDSDDGTEQAVCTVLLSLAAAVRELGECSFSRAQNNLDSIVGDALKSILREMFGKKCPSHVSLSNGFNTALNLVFGKDYDKFAHELNLLLALVWKVVAWEAVTSFAVLDEVELNEKIQGVQVNGENSKVDKKKKKVVLGKGTSLILPLIKDRLQSERVNTTENSGLLEIWVEDFLSFLDLKDPEFNVFLLKVKDIVESNESRRLPKIPKVILSSLKNGFIL